MSVQYVKYNKIGRIEYVGEVPESMLDLQGVIGVDMLIGQADPALDYVRAGALQRRPDNPAELAGKTLIGLPHPCVIRINQAAYNCNEPVATLEFAYPGMYQVTVEAFPYLNATFTLEQA